jgi:two-component system, NtrC family, nitrogen regulation sensor histidine kinase GlnL
VAQPLTVPRPAKPDVQTMPPAPAEAWAVLHALADAIVVVGAERQVLFANFAAEQLLGASLPQLRRRGLGHYLPADSPLFGLLDQVFATGKTVFEYGLALETPRIGQHTVNIQIAPIPESPATAVLSIHLQTIAQKIDRQLTHRGAARSVTAMAAMLAHEVKNPLSGIRGAAQLLEPALGAEERTLTKLICDETDRICAIVDRMEAFNDRPFAPREPINIHQVLDRVKAVAVAGFARGLKFTEDYDPSLPPVLGDRDRLIQVFLNLVKNAAEAVDAKDGEISLATAYRQGVRLAVPGADKRVHLPLVVSVGDNGPGIAEDIRGNLFDPFVTTKNGGSGLGLALVAKIVQDHGGVVEFASDSRGTTFNVLLPVHRAEGNAP